MRAHQQRCSTTSGDPVVPRSTPSIAEDRKAEQRMCDDGDWQNPGRITTNSIKSRSVGSAC